MVHETFVIRKIEVLLGCPSYHINGVKMGTSLPRRSSSL